MSSVTASASAVEFAATAARPPATQNSPGEAAKSAGAAASTGAVGKAGAAEEAQRAQAEPDRATLLQAVDEVRNAIKPVAQDLLFSIDDDSGRTVVKVVDSSTDEVIRQIPSKELLAISKALDKLQGLLLKQEA
ncbi:MAG: flagellar protein FlaG [Azoarcus sp.]|nr:flagellar protein FlaG [Azoarcus sp.]